MAKRKRKQGYSSKREEQEEELEEKQAGPSTQVKLNEKNKKRLRPITDVKDSDPERKERNRCIPEEAEIYVKLKSSLKRKFQHVVEGIANEGETRLLQDVYTDLYITEGGGGGWVNDEHEVRQIEKASWGKASECKPIKCTDIFHQLDGHWRKGRKVSFRTVLTKGVAGIGKTVSVQKFILDWAEEKANQDIHFLFSLPFRELNLMKNKTLSLVEFVQYFFPEIKTSRIFTTPKSKILFIFDGLDECRIPLDFQSIPRCVDVTEPVSVDVLLTNLIKGNLLPFALLWITTRPAAANQIPAECVDQVTEIRGFSDPQKEEYFRKRITDENVANRTITHLKSSRSLYIMCHIPVFCWITATVVERTSDQSQKVEMPRTLTQMYTHFLIVQTAIKKEKYSERKETDEEIIFKLGKLAFQQLEKGNLIFYEEDLRECGIDVTEASVYSGVCTQIFREEAGLYQGRVFSFVHLSIQEFLAALYVFLCFSNRERNMPVQQQTSQLSSLFNVEMFFDLHKTAVDLALQNMNGHLDLFLRFLLGLSLESNQNILMCLLPQTISETHSSEEIVQYIKQKIRDEYDSKHNSDRQINLFYCLNELNHHAVVETNGRSSGTLSVVMLMPGEWETRRFMFKIPEEQLDEFDLQKYIKTPEKDLTELLSPDEVLQRLVPISTSAWLESCFLTEWSCAALASAGRSNTCSLEELNLSKNGLRDAGVQHLSVLLKNPHCKLQKLVLKLCSLTKKSCAALAAAGRSNSCVLKELDLSNNDLHDAGVQHLSDLLKHPHCKLEKLELRWCSLTEKSCIALGSAGTSISCSLKELDLSHNKLYDVGVQHLSDLLKNPHYKVEKLELRHCLLTEKSCAVLASAGRSNSCSLKELDLSDNELHDAGIQHLSGLLKNPLCKLEKLELRCCFLTEKSCAALASAGRSAFCSLKELDLSDNYLYDAGVQHLSEIFKNPHCKLKKLELKLCSLTEKSCAALASAGKLNSCSLKELNLSHNELQDTGVQYLSDLFKNPHSKLEKLELVGCSLTEKSSTILASAACSTSCRLKELNLSENEFHDTGVQHLTDLLKNPHCKLEKLELVGCSHTEKSCTVLASAASPPPSSLEELDLSENEPYEGGLQNLSDLLKNLHCKFEKPIVCHQTRSRQRNCDSCAEVPDSSHWVLVRPEVSTDKNISTYSLSSPAGSYECSESGLRWSCTAPVTLQYRFMERNPETNELSHMRFCLAGPLMAIKLSSGELEEIHLPHFVCLGGSLSTSLKNAVKILHKDNSGLSVEKCELCRFHARLVRPPFSIFGPSFSLKTVVFSWREEMQLIPADVQVYKCRQSPLTFRTYLLPEDTHLCKLVEEQEKSEGFRGLRIPKPRPEKRLQINESYVLKTTCHAGKSTINPETINLRYSNIAPNFFEVCLTEACYFKMMLFSSKGNQEVWQAEFSRTQCSCPTPQKDNMNTSTVPESSCKHTANIRTPVKDEIPSGSTNPVQSTPVSTSLMAQTGAVAVCPSLYGNTFNGPVCFPGTDSTFMQLFCTAAIQTSVDQQTVYQADVLRVSQRDPT